MRIPATEANYRSRGKDYQVRLRELDPFCPSADPRVITIDLESGMEVERRDGNSKIIDSLIVQLGQAACLGAYCEGPAQADALDRLAALAAIAPQDENLAELVNQEVRTQCERADLANLTRCAQALAQQALENPALVRPKETSIPTLGVEAQGPMHIGTAWVRHDVGATVKADEAVSPPGRGRRLLAQLRDWVGL